MPSVSIVRTGNETIAADAEVTVAVDVQLSEVLAEDVTINLVGSGTATYSDDYTVSVGGTDCTGITEDDCQVMITAGQLTPSGDIEITIIDDERTNEPDESIILSMVIVSPENTDLLPRGPFTLTIPEDPPLPAVSISATSTSIAEGGNATLTATLTETVTENVVINLLEGGAADYGAGMDWQLNNGSDCGTATGTSCQITITAGQTTATAMVNINTDSNVESTPEAFTVSIDIASPDSTVVIPGTPSMLTFTIEDVPPPTVSLSYGGGSVATFTAAQMSIELSQSLREEITLNIVGSSTLTYDTQWVLNRELQGHSQPCSGIVGTDCQVTIPAGTTSSPVPITAFVSGSVTVSINIASAESTGLQLGSPVEQTVTIQ